MTRLYLHEPSLGQKAGRLIGEGCLPEYVRTASLLAAQVASDPSKKATLFAPLKKSDDSATVMIETARGLRSQYGAKVLLVEMQMARPSFAHRFGLQDAFSLRDLAEDRCPPRDVVFTAGENLSVIPACGSARGKLFDLAPLLRRIVDELTPSHDFVLGEVPPLADSADVLALLPVVPQVILVIEAGAASARTAGTAAETLRNAGADIKGTVLQSRRSVLPGWLRKGIDR